MKKFIDVIAEERVDYIAKKINVDSCKYDEILNKIKGIVSTEVLNLIDDLEGATLENHYIFEIEIYKQGLKDGLELKEL